MAYKDAEEEKRYQQNYHKNYKSTMLLEHKKQLKKVFAEYENVEKYLKEYIDIFGDLTEMMRINDKVTWYLYLLKCLEFHLEN